MDASNQPYVVIAYVVITFKYVNILLKYDIVTQFYFRFFVQLLSQ